MKNLEKVTESTTLSAELLIKIASELKKLKDLLADEDFALISNKRPLSFTIDLFDFSEEIKEQINLAVEHSGLEFYAFCHLSLICYANVLLANQRKIENLEDLSTEDLLKNPKYSTYPERPRELTYRSIKAIKMYNAMTLDPKERWIITSSLLHELTGSRMPIIHEVLEARKQEIDDYHANYPEFFCENGTLNLYWNRKRGINVKDKIDLIRLVPYG